MSEPVQTSAEPDNARPPQAARMSFWPRRRRTSLRGVPWFLVVPGLIFAIGVNFIAPVAGGWYSLTDWDGLGHAKYIGLANFRNIFKDDATRNALQHSVVLAVTFVVLANVIGLALALGLNRAVKSRQILRSLFFLPVVMSPLAVSFIWNYMFDYTGALNQWLRALGLESWQRPWLGDPKLALWTILIVMVWQWSGLMMVIYMAGLHGVPDELIEASAIDGAGSWMRFRRIILPLLAPAITVNLTLALIHGLRVFDQVMALTGGGPVDATETLATQVYKQTFVLSRYGYGSALALVLSGLVAVATLAQLRLLRSREATV
jgi:raffinose/stachyose/melibiose transport system permease protein